MAERLRGRRRRSVRAERASDPPRGVFVQHQSDPRSGDPVQCPASRHRHEHDVVRRLVQADGGHHAFDRLGPRLPQLDFGLGDRGERRIGEGRLANRLDRGGPQHPVRSEAAAGRRPGGLRASSARGRRPVSGARSVHRRPDGRRATEPDSRTSISRAIVVPDPEPGSGPFPRPLFAAPEGEASATDLTTKQNPFAPFLNRLKAPQSARPRQRASHSHRYSFFSKFPHSFVMNTDFPTSPRDGQNSSRYNPKIIDKKLSPQTDWAELVRQQQYYAEQMIQQEKDRKNQQKNELNEVLSSLVKDKEATKRNNQIHEKQEDFAHTMKRKQEYDQYLERNKQEKLDVQKSLANNYSQHQWARDEEMRKKNAQEKQMEERIISDALDSLQRENALKQKRRTEFIQSLDPLMQEREAQKRREQEKIQQDKEENRRLMEERARNLEMQEQNYKMYFQRVQENQSNLQQIYDQRVGATQRFKSKNIDDFVAKGIEESRRKAEQEELARQQKKQEQLRSMKESIQSKIQEHEEANMRQKLGYQNKVDELMKQNQQMQNFNEQQKREKAQQAIDYKNYLQNQMKNIEDQRRNYNSSMMEHEKKLHSNFDGLIPGIRSSKVDSQIPIHTRSVKNLSLVGSEAASPYNESSPYVSSPGSRREYQPDSIPSSQSVRNSSYNPFNTNNHDRYNPITNPIPNTVQNPYLGREFQRAGLSSVANKNLLV